MTTTLLPFAIPLAAVILAVGAWAFSNHELKKLRWPTQLGYYGFRRRVMRYLQQAGWMVDKSGVLQVDFFAVKRNKKFAVICLPADMPVTSSKMRDLASISPLATKSRPVVCVTLEHVGPHIVEDAARNNVRIIWYKELASL